MAAVATKKLFGDIGVQLTFPLNFAEAYNLPLAYYPSETGPPCDIMVGQDFQSQYHEEKRLQSNRSVMNGIQANKSKERKLLTGPHNYHLPRPVLGQRLYANPSCGADSSSSTRRDNGKFAPFKIIETDASVSPESGAIMPDAGQLRGGVVITQEGQRFYRDRLDARIGELDRLNALAEGYAVPMGQSVATYNNEKVGSFSKIDFFSHLQALMDSITEGDFTRFSFDSLRDLISLLLKFGPTANEADFNDMFQSLDVMLNNMRDGFDYDPEFALQISEAEKGSDYALTVYAFLEKIRDYCAEMFKNMYMSERDKLTLSKSLVTSLGLDRLLKKKSPADIIALLRKTNTRLNQEAEDYDDGSADGKFDRPAVAREDAEQPFQDRTPFAGVGGDPNRVRFGQKTGMIVYGGPNYFGEDAAQDAESQLVAPLQDAAFDPNAQTGNRVSIEALKDAVDSASHEVLLTFRSDPQNAGKDDEEIIAQEYPNPSDFVDDVVRNLKEQGMTPAQIAAGMASQGNEVFEEYIQENNGSIAPLSSTTNRPPIAPVSQPVFNNMDIAGADAHTAAVTLVQNLGLPLNAPAFKQRFDTMVKIRELGQRLPPELGGKYTPRADTKLKTAQQNIINRIRRLEGMTIY